MVDWNSDSLADIILPLNTAEKLSYEQCFVGPTVERTQQILIILRKAQEDLEEIISELEQEVS